MLPLHHHLFFSLFIFRYHSRQHHTCSRPSCMQWCKGKSRWRSHAKTTSPNRSRRNGFPISPYRIKSLLISDMLKVSSPEPSIMVSSFIARSSPSKLCFIYPSPPLLWCQMTHAHLMTNTPYMGNELANVSKLWQGSKLMSSLIFAGIFNLPLLVRAIDIGTSSSTTSFPLGFPGQIFSTSIVNCVSSIENSVNTEPETFQSSNHFKHSRNRGHEPNFGRMDNISRYIPRMECLEMARSSALDGHSN